MPTTDKGKAANAKGAKRPPKATLKEASASGTSASGGQKRPPEGPTHAAKKGKGIVVCDSDLDVEVARLALAPELERIVDLTAAHWKVHFDPDQLFPYVLIFGKKCQL